MMNKRNRVLAGMAVVLLTATVFAQAYSLPKSIERGKELYTTHCQNCHMADGKGTTAVFPPLAKTDYLKKPAKTWIDLVLKGQMGEITVNGEKYNGVMPAQNYLTDEQIADILNYARNSWGNKSPAAIMPAQVAKARQQ
jgi:nitrite reductase (NO-forming)